MRPSWEYLRYELLCCNNSSLYGVTILPGAKAKVPTAALREETTYKQVHFSKQRERAANREIFAGFMTTQEHCTESTKKMFIKKVWERHRHQEEKVWPERRGTLLSRYPSESWSEVRIKTTASTANSGRLDVKHNNQQTKKLRQAKNIFWGIFVKCKEEVIEERQNWPWHQDHCSCLIAFIQQTGDRCWKSSVTGSMELQHVASLLKLKSWEVASTTPVFNTD